MNLSIIIPHYNSPDLLQILLDSIGKHESTQILVVDDRSTKALDVFARVKSDPRNAHVTFLTTPEGHKGAGAARNTALPYATGKYVMFCDADDYLVSGYEQVIEPFLNQDTDLIYFAPISRFLNTDMDAHRTEKYVELIDAYLNQPCEATEDALRLTFYIPSSKLINRSLIETHQIRFEETMVSNDVMFSTQVGALAKTIDASRKTIYCLTRSDGSLTTTLSESNFDLRLAVGLRLHAYVRETIGLKRYRKIDLPGLVYIIQALQYHLGLKKAFRVWVTLKRHRVPIFKASLLKRRYFKNRHLG